MGGSRWTVSPGKGFLLPRSLSVTVREVLEPLSVSEESGGQDGRDENYVNTNDGTKVINKHNLIISPIPGRSLCQQRG